MNPPRPSVVTRRIAAWTLVASLLATAPGVRAGIVQLSDGTQTNGWALPNHLHVVTRHVPEARAVVVTVSYRMGTSDDPAGHEGLAELLAEVAFTGATDEVPERSREEMLNLRPLGWELGVNPYLTLLTEICEPDQLAGVLHQVASRMGGIAVTSQHLRKALATVKAGLEKRSEQADVVLHHAIRDAFAGMDEEAMQREVSGAGLASIDLETVRDGLAKRYVPANAVLAISGNLAGIDLERFTANEFGSIPSGVAAPPPAPPPFEPRSLAWKYAPAPGAMAALAVRAPALSDTTHPAFLLHTLILGGYALGSWGPPKPPRTSSYRYSLLDDPDLVRFYPPVGPQTTDPGAADEQFEHTLTALRSANLTDNIFSDMRQSIGWILGGPLPAHLASRIGFDLTLLVDLTTSMASRPHYGDARFWSAYRERLARTGPLDFMVTRQYLLDPANRTTLLLTR